MKIRCGDVVFMPYEYRRFGEVGPCKYKDAQGESIYEVYTIKQVGSHFEYDTQPLKINKKSIAEHYVVKDREDFLFAWISMGFEPLLDDDVIRFVHLVDHDYAPDSEYEASLSSESSENSDLRSNDTYSTLDETDSLDSFVTDTAPEKPEICECSFCDIDSVNRWFDRQWKPAIGTDEYTIKTLIENIESKYT
jgi:hypothetical protein